MFLSWYVFNQCGSMKRGTKKYWLKNACTRLRAYLMKKFNVTGFTIGLVACHSRQLHVWDRCVNANICIERWKSMVVRSGGFGWNILAVYLRWVFWICFFVVHWWEFPVEPLGELTHSVTAMYFNSAISRCAHGCARSFRKYPRYTELKENTPLLGREHEKYANGHSSVIEAEILSTELTLKDCEELGKTFLQASFFSPSTANKAVQEFLSLLHKRTK